MSLILDATKAAQREKERREGERTGSLPFMVPLRGKEASRFNWLRTAGLVAGGVAVLGAGYFAFLRTRDSVPRSLRTPGPSIPSIASAPPVSDLGKERARDTVPLKAAASPPAPGVRAPATRPRQSAKVAARPPVSSDTTSAGGSRSGGLHIAAEQPRELEAAQLFAIGVAAHRAGDFATARTSYERVLHLAPNDVDALNNLGVLYSTLREFDRAEPILRRVVALAPLKAGAWNNLGTVFRERGRSADAIAAFQRALDIEPRHPGARVSLAQQYLVIGSLPQARQLLEDVTASNPTLPEAQYALGQVLERQGDRAGAIRAYTAFVRVAPPALAPYVEAVRRRFDTLSRNP